MTPGSEPQHRLGPKPRTVDRVGDNIMNNKSTEHGTLTKPGEGLKVDGEGK